VRARNEASYVDQLDRQVARAAQAGGVVRLALDLERSAGAFPADVRDADIGVNRCKRVIANLCVGRCCSAEEG
ncbi:uncharacterized protein METZ01_LOCUS69092, partial [marine metagenome]